MGTRSEVEAEQLWDIDTLLEQFSLLSLTKKKSRYHIIEHFKNGHTYDLVNLNGYIERTSFGEEIIFRDENNTLLTIENNLQVILYERVNCIKCYLRDPRAKLVVVICMNDGEYEIQVNHAY